MFIIFIAGFIGGIIRGLVGFVKHRFAYKNVPFRLSYFLAMIFISGIIGLLAAIVVKGLGITFLGLAQFTPALAFVVGYAGGDFIENVVKITFHSRIKSKSSYDLGLHIKE